MKAYDISMDLEDVTDYEIDEIDGFYSTGTNLNFFAEESIDDLCLYIAGVVLAETERHAVSQADEFRKEILALSPEDRAKRVWKPRTGPVK